MSLPVLDDPRQWYEFIPPPVEVKAKQFQTYLNRTAGRNARGLPVVRLVWGWSEEARDWRAGEWRFRYRFHTVYLKTQDIQIDLAVPRWFLEELMEPVQYIDQWEQQRFHTDEVTGEYVDVLGQPPVDGWYMPLRTIAHHTKYHSCCKYQWDNFRRNCWGTYRPPSDSDLSDLSRAIQMRDNEKQLNRPDEKLSPEVFALAAAVQFEKKEAEDIRRKETFRELWRDAVRTHGHSWGSDDPGVASHGKYHFLRNSSGLFVPGEKSV